MKRNSNRAVICFPRLDFSYITPSSEMPVNRFYYPDVNLTLTAKYSDNKSLANGMRYSLMMKDIGIALAF